MNAQLCRCSAVVDVEIMQITVPVATATQLHQNSICSIKSNRILIDFITASSTRFSGFTESSFVTWTRIHYKPSVVMVMVVVRSAVMMMLLPWLT